MTSWIKLAILLLRFAQQIVEWQKEKGLIKRGEDAAIGRAALELARSTEWAKEIERKVDDLSDTDLLDLLQPPGPPEDSSPPELLSGGKASLPKRR